MSSTELSERLEREYRASASAPREPYDWEAEGTFDDWEDEGALGAHDPIRAEADEWAFLARASFDPERYEEKVQADTKAELRRRAARRRGVDVILAALGAFLAGMAAAALVIGWSLWPLAVAALAVGGFLALAFGGEVWRFARQP